MRRLAAVAAGLLPLLVVAGTLSLVRAAAAQPAGSIAAQGRGRAVLTGVVTDSAGTRIGGATVRLDRNGGVTISDDDGRFAIAGLPAGRVGATVRRLGFLPADFELELQPGTRVELAVKLAPSVAALPTVVVDGERRELLLQANGFYERARFGNGTFLRPEFLEARRGVPLSTVLREVPRVTMRCEGTGGRCRAVVGTPARACEATLWVDGMRAPDGVLDEVVSRDRVRGVEVYASAAFVPGDFVQPGDTCGAIAIWTEVAPTWSHYLPRQRLSVPALRPDSAPPRIP